MIGGVPLNHLLGVPERQFDHVLDHIPGTSGTRRAGVEITNLTINPGDLISMLICTPQGAGSTTATIFFGNQTSGVSTSYQITAPSGTKLAGTAPNGSSRRTVVGGVLTQMPDYGEVFFSNCEGYLTNGSVINGGTGQQHQPGTERHDGPDRDLDHADDH